MPTSKTDRAEWTFRTDVPHRDVIDVVAAQYGLNRQDFMALWNAETLGLPRPSRTPAVPLSVDDVRLAAQQAWNDLVEPGEVLPQTA